MEDMGQRPLERSGQARRWQAKCSTSLTMRNQESPSALCGELVAGWGRAMRFCSPEAAAECERYAAEYKAKAETAAPSDRQSFAEIAKRFVAMARGCVALDPLEPERGGERPALVWRLN